MNSTFTTAIVRGTVGAGLLTSVVGVVSAQQGGGMGGMGGGMGGFGWWPLLWALVLLSVVVLVASSVRGNGSQRDGRDERDEALAALRTRYANGELSDEEFEERRRRLQE